MYAKYKSTLPATPCTLEMRNKIVAYSKSKGQSVSQTKREAFALFLAQIDTDLLNESASSYQETTREVQG